jgi:hypothetical protein
MLDELCKGDKEWRKMAFHFCKSKELADDIVQDMYLKFANYNKPINDHYIFFALKTIFLDYLRIDKRIQTINIDLFPFEVQKKIDEINYDFYDYETDYLKESFKYCGITTSIISEYHSNLIKLLTDAELPINTTVHML